MTNLAALKPPGGDNEREESPSIGTPALREISGVADYDSGKDPLLVHLKKLSNEGHLNELLELLRDIRTHKAHPSMTQAFEDHQHDIVEGFLESDQDFLALISKDYIEGCGFGEGEDFTDPEHQRNLKAHVDHVIMTSLLGYQEVVVDIRADISGLENKIQEDESVSNLKDLLAVIDHDDAGPAVRRAIDELESEHPAHHIFHGHSENIDHALATVAMQHASKGGELDHDLAISYLREDFHGLLADHFETPLYGQSEKVVRLSNVYISNAAVDRIRENRLEDKRLNAAFSLLDELKNGSSEQLSKKLFDRIKEDRSLSERIIPVLENGSDLAIERVVSEALDGTDFDLTKLKNEVEPLLAIYVRKLNMEDGEIAAGLMSINQTRATKHLALTADMIAKIPNECVELRSLLEGDEELPVVLADLWLKAGPGDIASLNKIIRQAAEDAEYYLHTKLLKTSASRAGHEAIDTSVESSDPSSSLTMGTNHSEVVKAGIEDEFQAVLVNKLENSATGSTGFLVCQVLSNAIKNYRSHEGLQKVMGEDAEFATLIQKFESGSEGVMARLAHAYVSGKTNASLKDAQASTFDVFLEKYLNKLKSALDEDTYKFLTKGQSHETVASDLPLREDKISHAPDDSTLELKEGYDTSVTIANKNSTIVVPNNAKLSLFLAMDNVTIQLMGPKAFVSVDRIGVYSERICFKDVTGRIITETGVNIKLGEGIEDKMVVLEEHHL